MKKIDLHIEIVSSALAGLSSMNRISREAVYAVLTEQYTYVKISIVNNIVDLEALVARNPDLVFLGMKFIPLSYNLNFHNKPKIWIAQYLAEHGIVSTGSGHEAYNLEYNKPLAKRRLLSVGLKTAAFVVIKQNQSLNSMTTNLSYPLFIKPTNGGGGSGIDSASYAHNFGQLEAKVLSLQNELRTDVLIEEYLSGREFSVAILKGHDSNKYLTMPIELVAEQDARGERILTSAVKSSNAEQVLALRDARLRNRICQLALEAFYVLNARDYGRIDVRLSMAGTPYFLEANLMPSLIDGYGSFPKACALDKQIDYKTMILSIVNLAMARKPDISESTSNDDIAFDDVAGLAPAFAV